ncbi:hypothetical protein [Senegalia sp. (in: firmicutes)]|uniref:hypothetical protein n=1 Tax=Senegalia sp. (in: firmicutes) TaxID=1924098 RepID=UPI003F95A748
MKGSLFVIISSVLIIIYELPNLKGQNCKKEIYSFAFLLLIATILGILKSFNVEIPNPLKAVEIIYRPLNNIFN